LSKKKTKSKRKTKTNSKEDYFYPCEIFYKVKKDEEDVFSYLIKGFDCKKKTEGICPLLRKSTNNETPKLSLGNNFDILMIISKDGIPLWKKEYGSKKRKKNKLIDPVQFNLFAGTFSAINSTFSLVVGDSIGLVKSSKGKKQWLIKNLESSNWLLIAQTSLESITTKLFEKMCKMIKKCFSIPVK